MTGYAQMVTQFHTLLHSVTLFPLILSPSACVAASTSIQGVSKSHLLSIYVYVASHCSGACTHEAIPTDNSKSHFRPNNYGSLSSVDSTRLSSLLSTVSSTIVYVAITLPLHSSSS